MTSGNAVDGAITGLLEEAAAIGMDGGDIVSLFSERHPFGCWRFDGERIQLASNFAEPKSPDISRCAEDSPPSGQHKVDPEARLRLQAEMRDALAERRGFSHTYQLTLPDGTQRRFLTVAKFRSHPDGGEDVFGIAYEVFQPTRKIYDYTADASAGDGVAGD